MILLVRNVQSGFSFDTHRDPSSWHASGLRLHKTCLVRVLCYEGVAGEEEDQTCVEAIELANFTDTSGRDYRPISYYKVGQWCQKS